MQFKKEKDFYIVSLDLGEKIHESLGRFASSEKLTSWWHQGIGVLKDPHLGFYDIKNKKYLEKDFQGDFEILSISGNLTEKEGKAFIHSHVSLSGPDFTAIGGHLFEATIGAAAEFAIWPAGQSITRKFDPASGLFVLDL